MRPTAFQCAAAVSFAVCLAVLGFWLRSYHCSDKLHWSTTRGWRSVRTAAGHLEVGLLIADWSDQPSAEIHLPKYERGVPHPPLRLFLLCSSRGDTDIHWERAGFSWNAKLNSQRGVYHSITVFPCWFLAAASAILPLLAAVPRLSRRSVSSAGAACHA